MWMIIFLDRHISQLHKIPATDYQQYLLKPLFQENAHSLAMVNQGMDVIAQATHLVHPGQAPILTVGQLLFVIAKKIQWT